jgi:hypothetical protein
LYRLNVLDEARAEIAALPQQILPALAEAMAVLEAAPWSGEPQNESNPDGAVRRLLFGPAGAGQIVYLLLDRDHLVEVLLIVWVGD